MENEIILNKRPVFDRKKKLTNEENKFESNYRSARIYSKDSLRSGFSVFKFFFFFLFFLKQQCTEIKEKKRETNYAELKDYLNHTRHGAGINF